MSKGTPTKTHGGKAHLASKIISLFPKRYLTYCEPYFGGGSVLLGLNPNGHSEVVNDIDGELMNFWRVLQKDAFFTEFCRLISSVPFSEAEFKHAKESNCPPGYFPENWQARRAALFLRCPASLSQVASRHSHPSQRRAFVAA